ncbi:uncharacterized protein LOC144878611 [Branchiostoma floridae x Branchiostoma japonicum]
MAPKRTAEGTEPGTAGIAARRFYRQTSKGCRIVDTMRAAAQSKEEADLSASATAEPEPKRKKPSQKCGCRGDCRSRKCGCGKKGEACGDSCKCTGCKNPFNILKEFNIDGVAAAQDNCLMDNIFKIKDLRCRLKQRHSSACCGYSLQLKNMLPGSITVCSCSCCKHEWQYSWCRNEFEDWETRPRYHCNICRKCGDYRDAHCKKCNKCYFAGTMGGFECPCQDQPTGDVDTMDLGTMDLSNLWAFLYVAGFDLDSLRDESEAESEKEAL